MGKIPVGVLVRYRNSLYLFCFVLFLGGSARISDDRPRPLHRPFSHHPPLGYTVLLGRSRLLLCLSFHLLLCLSSPPEVGLAVDHGVSVVLAGAEQPLLLLHSAAAVAVSTAAAAAAAVVWAAAVAAAVAAAAVDLSGAVLLVC